jgi:hypothetical protein
MRKSMVNVTGWAVLQDGVKVVRRKPSSNLTRSASPGE